MVFGRKLADKLSEREINKGLGDEEEEGEIWDMSVAFKLDRLREKESIDEEVGRMEGWDDDEGGDWASGDVG